MTKHRSNPVVRHKHGPLPEFIRSRLSNTISFYFSNIHDDTKKGELWKVFGRCGKVKDVFIPAKKNKDGARFGFVRFTKDSLGEALLEKLDNVWVQSLKIKVNVSLFDRELVVAPQAEEDSPVQILPSGGFSHSKRMVDDTSFAAVKSPSPGIFTRTCQNVKEVVCEVPAGRMDELSDSVVGLLLPGFCVQKVREALIIAGMPNIKVRSLGGNQVLVDSNFKGLLKDSLLERRGWWLSWFKGFTRWSVDVPPPGRCAWLRITGVPVQLWCDEAFAKVGALFGEVLQVEAGNLQFELGRVRVLISNALRVDEPVVLVEEGSRFVAYVSEDAQFEEISLRPSPETGCSGADGGACDGDRCYLDAEAWAENLGDSSSSSGFSDTSHHGME